MCFMTATWGPDLGHFRWLRRSIEKSGLASVPHVVVVQTEDVPLFEPLARDGVQLLSTAEVLPAEVEARRVEARRRAQRYGRRLTKFSASLNKRFGWCAWMRYSGWHVQQVTKLTASASDTYDLTVVLDSDLLVTRAFDLRLFVPDGKVAAFEEVNVTPDSPGLQWKWHQNACRLLKLPVQADRQVDGYVGTPFVLERDTVRSLQHWLESTYARPWYEAMLSQPLAGWSEFCTYNQFARTHGRSPRLAFARNPHHAGLDTASDRRDFERIIRAGLENPQTYFLHISSDRRGSMRWPAEHYEPLLREILN
jgi:hypothetical protein